MFACTAWWIGLHHLRWWRAFERASRSRLHKNAVTFLGCHHHHHATAANMELHNSNGHKPRGKRSLIRRVRFMMHTEYIGAYTKSMSNWINKTLDKIISPDDAKNIKKKQEKKIARVEVMLGVFGVWASEYDSSYHTELCTFGVVRIHCAPQ